MFGFPLPLFDNTTSAVKLAPVADSGFPKLSPSQTFYSIKAGNWSDISVWQTASEIVGVLPTANDDVCIRHAITQDTSATINNLFVSNVFTINATFTLTLVGKFIGSWDSQLINKGTINFSTQTAAIQSYSSGIVDFTSNTNTVQFSGDYNAILPATYTTYSSLTVGGTGTKQLGTDTTVNGNLSLTSSQSVLTNPAIFECASYNLTVSGTSSINCSFYKSGSGSLLFVGLHTIQQFIGYSLLGNPTIEFRGGLTINFATINFGTGTCSFTTNNQTITAAASGAPAFGTTSIVGAITVTNAVASLIGFSSIDCTSASGSLVNKGTVNFTTNTTSFTLGTFDISSFANTVGYTGNYTLTLPYTTYSSLNITGTGTKTLGGNTTLTGNLTGTNGILELSTFNFTVNGTSSILTLTKSGAGSVLFIGAFSVNQFGSATFTGNPTIEFRGGTSTNNSTINTGTGTVSFTTNNQTIAISGVLSTCTFQAISIVGAITVTVTSSVAIIINGALDGNNASSKLLMGTGSPSINYKSATKPFATNGVLDTSTNTNTWIYGNSNQDILGGPDTSHKQVHYNLTLNGGGTKTLQGYVSVTNTYTLTAPATLNLNGYTLTNP